jgi:hypothetical protein
MNYSSATVDSYRSNDLVISSSSIQGDPILICATYEYAYTLINSLIYFLSLLRLVTLVANLTTSIAYHIKFRNEYVQSLRNDFMNIKNMLNKSKKTNELKDQEFNNNNQSYFSSRGDEQLFDKINKKVINFKQFSFIYSTTEPLLNEKLFIQSCNNSNKNNNGSNKTQPEVHRTNFDLARAKNREQNAKIKSYFYQLHFNHFHFVRHYVLMVIFYSILIAPSILHDNYLKFESLLESKKNLKENKLNQEKYDILIMINLTNSTKSDYNSMNANDDLFFNMTRCIAHSIKFFVYILFSAHFKFYFEYLKKFNSNNNKSSNSLSRSSKQARLNNGKH